MPVPLSNHPNANLIRRLMAIVYDLFPLFGIFMGVVMIFFLPLRILVYGLNDQWLGFNLPLQILLVLLMIFALSSYFYFCWRKQGQTLGMKAWNIKLVQNNGELVTRSQCLNRLIFSFLSLACLGFGYWWYFFSTRKSCLQDELSNTKVILSSLKSESKNG